MEWIIITAKTLDEAKDRALDQLGVDEQDAEFEVVEEPKPGLFGRLRGNYELRARVAPTAPRAKDSRRQPRKRKGKDSGSGNRGNGKSNNNSNGNKNDGGNKGGQQKSAPADNAPAKSSSPSGGGSSRSQPQRQKEDREQLALPVAIDATTAFLETLVEKYGVTATVSVVEEPEGEIMARIDGEQLGRLIGPGGGMVAALEELCRTRLQHVAEGAPTPRLRVDVGGYLGLRRANLEALVDTTIEQVRETGTVHVMDVVRAVDRKLVHDRVGEAADDVTTKSEGEDPHRRVAIVPVSSD